MTGFHRVSGRVAHFGPPNGGETGEDVRGRRDISDWGYSGLLLGAMLGDIGGGLGAAGELELLEDRAHVRLDGMLAQEELARDLAVGLALGDERKDTALLLRESRERV